MLQELVLVANHFQFNMSTTATGEIVNKVANSALQNIDLADFLPKKEIVELDISQFLFHGLMLKEKEYREHLKNHDWKQYENKILAVYCSTDAIFAPWAYMLVVQYATSYTDEIRQGNKQEIELLIARENLNQFNWSKFENAKILVKGCGDKSIPYALYADASSKLIKSGADKIMYGEACSFVPVYKKPK